MKCILNIAYCIYSCTQQKINWLLNLQKKIYISDYNSMSLFKWPFTTTFC